jgi:hypothetical protein
MEQDPAGKSPYSYVKGVDYVNQVVEDSPNLLPGIGVLIDPARLRGSAIEKKNPYYIPMYGMRIYGKNPDDVVNIAGKIDEKYFKPKSTFSFKRKEVSTAVGAPGFFDRFKKKTPAAPAPKKTKTKRVRNSKNVQKQKRANRAKPVEADYSTGNMFKSNNSNDFEPIAAAPAAAAPAAAAPAAAAPPARRTGTPARSANRGVIGQQTQRNTRTALEKHQNKTKWMQPENTNRAINDLFKNDDAPTQKQAGMTAAEAIASAKGRAAPNQATRNMKARAASLKKQQAAIPRNTSKIENFKPEGSVPNSFYNEPAEVTPAKPAKKGKKAPLSQEAIEAAKAAGAAKTAERKKQANEEKKRKGFTSLFQGGSRKMRKPKRGARTFRKRRV